MATNGDGPPAMPRAESPSGSPRAATTSLQAAAAMNASLQREPSRQSSSSSLARNLPSPQTGRRRSTVFMNLQLNDPSVPAPGEMAQDQSGQQRASPQPLSGSPRTADPHHYRAPSLGELHQELEAEQEAHVNRLLQMIRQQQLELQRLQAHQPHHTHRSSIDESAGAERLGQATPQAIASHASQPIGPSAGSYSGSYSRSPGFPHPRSSFDMGRADLHRRSRTPSRGASPRLRSTSISLESPDWVLGGRDESAFYQAETQMLVRENQMLRHRIRDLEKQVTDLSVSPSGTSEPSVPSNLALASISADEIAPTEEAPRAD